MRDHALPYPMIDEPLTLPSGRVVQVYNIIVFHGPSVSAGIQYGTTISSADLAARLSEAGEVVELHAASFTEQGATRVTAQFCGTRAQAEMREAPEQTFLFERGDDGRWRCSGEVVLPSR